VAQAIGDTYGHHARHEKSFMVVEESGRSDQREAQRESWREGASSRARFVHLWLAAKLQHGANGPRKLTRGEQVSQLFFLGAKVFLGMRAGYHFAGDTLDDSDSGALKGFNLVRII
jgi:hypothetical protein